MPQKPDSSQQVTVPLSGAPNTYTATMVAATTAAATTLAATTSGATMSGVTMSASPSVTMAASQFVLPQNISIIAVLTKR